MAGYMFSNLLLWSLSHDFYITGRTYFAPKKQSWSKQNLSSVPQGLNHRLRRLDLSNNFITQLHVLALPDLEQLDLSSNRLDLISEGAFAELARLERLNLSRNRLNVNLGSNSKALRSLGGLKNLDISKNSLNNKAAELFLKNKSSLDHLQMTGNALIRLSHSLFRESRGLRSIRVDDNLISEIEEGTFEPLSRLETLNLAKNNLPHICDFKLPQVKYLNLSRNSVEFFVTREDFQLYSLEILDLSHNKLLYFPIVPKMNRLKYLHLQHNVLGALNSEAEMVSESNDLYIDIINERTVRKNHLHANWRLMPLVYIDLSFNHFTSFPIETLSLLSSLQTLHFGYNCLRSINWNIRNENHSKGVRQLFFSSLKHLDLQSNGLAFMSLHFVKALTHIETLNLQDNLLKPCAVIDDLHGLEPNLNKSCVEFEQLKTLKHLVLRENDIKILPFNAFRRTSLISLDLARNPNMVMHKGALEGLQTTLRFLMISETNMSHLSLPCMSTLTELNISNNNLNRLPSGLSCSPLNVIDIRNNHFTTLNHSLVRVLSANLSTVFISGNRMNCCDSRWMMDLIEMKVHLPDLNETECFTHERDLNMVEYLRSSLLHCLFPGEVQGVQFGQMIIILLFTAVLLVGLVVFSRKLCCTQGSLIV